MRDTGAVYPYALLNGKWVSEAPLSPLGSAWFSSNFGASIAVSDEQVFVGAPTSNAFEQDAGAGFLYRQVGVRSTFCNGSDGALVSCPCDNAGAPDRGCDNASGTGGVRAEVSSFDVISYLAEITSIGYPGDTNPAAVLFRSVSSISTAPFVLGDGLSCTSLSVTRLDASVASGGQSTHTFGHGADAGLYHYQAWYRSQPASYCQPGGFNLSSGVSILWP